MPSPDVRPRGILLLGVPGTGKSAFAKALGNETGRPTLVLDVGALLGSLVGQTEQNVRQALRIADAMAPCVLYCDEIKKAMAGAASSGVTDSGVTARLFRAILPRIRRLRLPETVPGCRPELSKLARKAEVTGTVCPDQERTPVRGALRGKLWPKSGRMTSSWSRKSACGPPEGW